MRFLTLVTVALAAIAAAHAGTLNVEGAGGLDLAITTDLPMTLDGPVPGLRGQVTIAPRADGLGDQPLMLFVDGVARGLTSNAGGSFELDTQALTEGEHALRVDAVRGEQLIASTGAVPVMVVNSIAAPAVEQVPALGGERPAFIKLYKPRIFHEILYFNNREADLEKHAFIRGGRVYITLTDLMRHIGGSIIWGPEDDQMNVHRNGMIVTVRPHSSTVWVDGVARDLGHTTLRTGNRTYVPVKPFCALFGISTDWDFQTDRAYVTYQG